MCTTVQVDSATDSAYCTQLLNCIMAQVLNDHHYHVIHLSSLVFALRLQSLQEHRVDYRLALMERILDVAL